MRSAQVSLKQRLSNLSSAAASATSTLRGSDGGTSSRTPSFTGLSSAFNKRKAPWNNLPNRADGSSHNIDEVISQMIFQAGVDFETRPMIVMNASAFPDPRVISYDLLLSRILSYLDLFVESDYTVVFFAAGGHHTPSWNWVWKAYRSLKRKYRKNLKRLFIVHSSFFSKMLFSLAGAIISPKFFRKITYIDTLSSLACHVPLTQIDIPPSVYSENLKHESQITLPMQVHSQMFGVPLEELMGFDGEKDGLPRVVRDCITYLMESGMNEEGLFRRSPNSAQLKQVREAYDRGQTVSLSNFGDPHLAAVLLKKFLRDLPQPIFPESTYEVIRRCPDPRDDQEELDAISYIRGTLLPELAPCTLILLSRVLLLLHEVSQRSNVNRMDAHNLAIVLTPNLVSSGNPLKDVAICGVAGAPQPLSPGGSSRTGSSAPAHPAAAEVAKHQGRTTLGTIIKLCIARYYEVFDEIADRTEAISAHAFNIGSTHDDMPPPSSSPSPEPAMTTEAAAEAKRRSILTDDDSIDDGMLVMPVGPGSSSSPVTRRFPATASVTTGENNSRLTSLGTMSVVKARSLLTPSSSDSTGLLGASRRGTLARGTRGGSGPPSAAGTMRSKSSGAGVAALSVTASGFFAPPSDAPPVPPLPPPKHPMSVRKANESNV